MATNKRYGVDGPPHLSGLSTELSADGRHDWIAAGADWLSRADASEWTHAIRCRCGRTDSFKIFTGGVDSPGWISGDPFGGIQRCDARCQACRFEFVLFDDGLHGYNAVVCDERSHLPAEYLTHNRKLLQPVLCDCGERQFAVVALARYDCGDDLTSMPESQWGDAYGSFLAAGKCVCGKIQIVADAETA